MDTKSRSPCQTNYCKLLRRDSVIAAVHRQTRMHSFHDTFSFGEVTSVDVTRIDNSVGATSFHVFTSEQELMHDQFRIANVVVAIHGPDLSGHQLHVAVWDANRFMYSSLIDPSDASVIHFDLRTRLHGFLFDRLYTFDINAELLGDSWCSIMTPHPVDGKTECVLRFKDFGLLEKRR
ncbi:hypothetical protein [Rhodopirellula sp. MGV]|uniref:hypothetical protein n=1 Tax=Rhodopirellula sp. MGV TaxID=2023130 RepID=UPI00117A0617|nr:hypothetical protein [Rhodopirellula sp. MGV]